MDMSYMNLYKSRMNVRGTTIPEMLRKNSDMIMERSWYTTPEVRRVRLFKHKAGTYGHLYQDVAFEDARFIHKSVQEISSQQVEYYLMFKPGVEYPLGTYVEIVDEFGHINNWLICKKSMDMQFVLYNILPCNYLFKWVAHNHVCECLGVLRGLNSYSAGIKENEVFINADNRCKMFLPTDDVTRQLTYDKRLVISAEGREIPLVWKCTKIEELTPIGISTITVDQDVFNRDTDYNETYGYVADINSDVIVVDKDEESVKPVVDPHTTSEDDKWEIRILADIRSKKPDGEGNYSYSEIINHEVKFGNTVRFICKLYDENDQEVVTHPITPVWEIEGIEDGYTYVIEDNILYLSINRDYNLGGDYFTIIATADEGKFETSLELEVIT